MILKFQEKMADIITLEWYTITHKIKKIIRMAGVEHLL
jgi:hypothetical protein